VETTGGYRMHKNRSSLESGLLNENFMLDVDVRRMLEMLHIVAQSRKFSALNSVIIMAIKHCKKHAIPD
jgi:hypothetical protein